MKIIQTKDGRFVSKKVAKQISGELILREISVVTTLEEWRIITPKHPILDVNIRDLDLSVRAFCCLKTAGIKTLRELFDLYTVQTVFKMRNFGMKSFAEIEKLRIKAEYEWSTQN
jgi:DNA-directed RNA polymerase subunit alpha